MSLLDQGNRVAVNYADAVGSLQKSKSRIPRRYGLKGLMCYFMLAFPTPALPGSGSKGRPQKKALSPATGLPQLSL